MDNKPPERDLIGDQIGWSVRQMLPPGPQLRKLDRVIMLALPKPIQRWVAVERFNRGWLPEVKIDPLEYYNDELKQMGKLYLDEYGLAHSVNTLLVTSVGEPLKIHSERFKEGEKERIFRWDNQFRWAQTIQERVDGGENVSTEDQKEALAILILQERMNQILENLKPQFIKRGLPFPWTPTPSKAPPNK